MKFHKKEKKKRCYKIVWSINVSGAPDYNQSVICYEVTVSQPKIC